MLVRKATEDDAPAIMAMMDKFWRFTDYYNTFGIGHDPRSSVHTLAACLEQDMVVVAEDDGLIGFAAGMAIPLIGNHAYRMGMELAWWIEPEHRNAGNGQALLEGLENAARENGVDYWNMISMESATPEAAAHLYEKNGYRKTETTFLKEL